MSHAAGLTAGMVLSGKNPVIQPTASAIPAFEKARIVESWPYHTRLLETHQSWPPPGLPRQQAPSQARRQGLSGLHLPAEAKRAATEQPLPRGDPISKPQEERTEAKRGVLLSRRKLFTDVKRLY